MLKRIFILALVGLFSCNDTKREQEQAAEKPKDYKDLVKINSNLKPKSDTIALGFVFGQTEQEVEKHFDKLVNEKKVDPKTVWEIPLFDTKINLKGYPYELFLSDTVSCRTLISYSFYNNKLSTLTFFCYTDLSTEKVRELLENKFGKYQTTKTDSSSYSSKPSYFWFDGYKQIALVDGSLTSFGLEYTDLRTEVAKDNDKKLQDSLDLENRKKKAENSKEDLK